MISVYIILFDRMCYFLVRITQYKTHLWWGDGCGILLLTKGIKYILPVYFRRNDLKGDSQLYDRADLDTRFPTLKKVHLNLKSKLRVEYLSKSSKCFAQFSIVYWNTVFEYAFVHLMILFYHIWLKTVSISSPKEHEKKRWETWRRRAEEIAFVG